VPAYIDQDKLLRLQNNHFHGNVAAQSEVAQFAAAIGNCNSYQEIVQALIKLKWKVVRQSNRTVHVTTLSGAMLNFSMRIADGGDLIRINLEQA
jgi:hypothetical protein